jgi:hypothetical protein
MFAACNGNIYDVSVSGAPVVVVSGLGSNRWQYINFTPGGSATHYLIAVNGTDTPLIFNGTTWTTTSWTGITQSSVSNINIYQRRIWLTINQSTTFGYLAADSIAGAVTLLDIGALWDLGGQAVSMGTWTVDGGSGPNNYAAFMSSRGQITVYLGTDPNTVSTWNLVGTFNTSPPLGNRCMLRLGSDLAIITLQGVIPISQALPFDPSAVRSVAITSQIQNAMAAVALAGQNLFGWQLIAFPSQTLLILNVPIVTNQSQQQFVMNTLTGAWCQFVGWNANCFELYNDLLYFGDNIGNVNQAYVGPADLISPIVADMKCAFNYLGDPEKLKHMTMLQPLLVSSGQITPTISVDVDFADSSPTAPVTSFTASGAIWDVSKWDASQWASPTVTVTSWLSAQALGRALAVRMKVNFTPAGAGSTSVFDTGVFDTMVFDGFGTTNVTLQVNGFNSIVEMGGVV